MNRIGMPARRRAYARSTALGRSSLHRFRDAHRIPWRDRSVVLPVRGAIPERAVC